MFERKNKKLKEIALGTTCNQHLPTTIAIRHQLQLCYDFEFNEAAETDILFGPIENNNMTAIFKRIEPSLPSGFTVVSLKYIKIYNKKLKEGTIIITAVNEVPQFSKIKNCS